MSIYCNDCGEFVSPAPEIAASRHPYKLACGVCFSTNVAEIAKCDRKGCKDPAAKGTDYCAKHDAEITAMEAAHEARQERGMNDHCRSQAA